MTRYYLRLSIFVIMLLLSNTSFGHCAQRVDQSILSESKIKKKSFKKVFREIKKTLPKQLRKCPIVVTDIRLLKSKNGGVAEDWTVDICQDEKTYFISTFHPKGYFCTVVPKEEQFAHERKLWSEAKKFGDKEEWRETLFYIDELEAMD